MSQRTVYPSIEWCNSGSAPWVQASGVGMHILTGTLFGMPFGCSPALQMTGALTLNAANGADKLDTVAYHFIWTTPNGTSPTGLIMIEQSMDFDPQRLPGFTGTWSNIGVSPTVQPAANNSSSWVAVTNVASPWLRWKYVPTSGTGSLVVYSCGKGII